MHRPSSDAPPLTAYFLVGPTAAGKTAVAQCLAERHGLAVLSADSMLVYRGMDVGTAKPTARERGRTVYGGLDLVTPDRDFSVWQYREAALRFAAAQRRAGRGLVVAGGTGLYVRALLGGLDAAAPTDPARRAHWEDVLEREGVDALRAALQRLRPDLLAGLADPHNPRRVLRALERAEAGAGSPERTWRADPANPRPMLCGLELPAAALTERIERRARNMFDQGLIEEVQRLCAQWPRWSRTARQAIGYAEAIEVIDGRASLDEARLTTIARTRRLAKKQRTWFRRQESVEWVQAGPDEALDALAARVWEAWQKHGPGTIVTG